ncbi:MAG: Ca2+-dependent phosphoinositide-specific phospholipase C [Planctomycetota bacterium]|nr:Ca2+-dependent phosphoinositide-specific phospholipase C [Planctomycetota bacterium]MEC9048225.1 Ca2+-dependent phosphoinositide-specific phospholipase C [Planctomycetota bacterium]
MSRHPCSMLFVGALAVLSACRSVALPGAGLRLNELQVIGTHNSFKQRIQPELLSRMKWLYRDAGSLDYGHAPIPEQLALGVRNLEFDVYRDPQGGRYARPLGNRLLGMLGAKPWPLEHPDALGTPGFKVLHDCDFDFRSHHVAFEDYLDELRAFSEAHPEHVPIFVTMNIKQGSQGIPGTVDGPVFDAEAFRELDRLVAARLQGHLITPDLVRGDAESLQQAVLSRGWPQVDEVRGRYLFLLDAGGATRGRYLRAFPGLRGATYFTVERASDPNAAFFIVNDPVGGASRIRALVERGFMVRTRADSGTREARAGDLSRFDAAKQSGAQVISTDYPSADEQLKTGYRVRFDDQGFVRDNPVARPRRRDIR